MQGHFVVKYIARKTAWKVDKQSAGQEICRSVNVRVIFPHKDTVAQWFDSIRTFVGKTPRAVNQVESII